MTVQPSITTRVSLSSTKVAVGLLTNSRNDGGSSGNCGGGVSSACTGSSGGAGVGGGDSVSGVVSVVVVEC